LHKTGIIIKAWSKIDRWMLRHLQLKGWLKRANNNNNNNNNDDDDDNNNNFLQNSS